MSRQLIIQRYASGNWTMVRGIAPFIATGPNFKSWVIPGSLDKHREYRFRSTLANVLYSEFPKGESHEAHYCNDAIAEFLLSEGIVQALWAVNSPDCPTRTLRWGQSILAVAREIHYGLGEDIVKWTVELLSGMNDPSHYHTYVQEDGVVLEPAVLIGT